jgi:hypothetical protein
MVKGDPNPRQTLSGGAIMKQTHRIDYTKLLGFDSVSDQIEGSIDFQDETIGAKLGAKVGIAPAPCYLRGTHIRTPEGERRIEELKIGDRVDTLSGESKPIKWIGRQRYKKSSECWPKDFEPVRIGCFALDKRTPHRDLYLSPGHAVYIDGVLIPAKYLVNGLNITQCAPDGADIIEYLHIELFVHDVIFAEGATAETYLMCENRDHFDNFAEYHRLHSNEYETAQLPCAPLLWERHPRVERAMQPLRNILQPWIDVRSTRDKIRDRLAARAEELIDS